MIADIKGVREIIDQMTPDLRVDMPTTATEYGNRLFGMYLCGMASFLENDEVPWPELAGDRNGRLRVAMGLRLDGIRVYHGQAEDA